MQNAKDKLKKLWNDKPVETLLIGSLVVTSTAKLIDAVSAAQGRRAYAKQVRHSTRRTRR